jgi:hypothetical protein
MKFFLTLALVASLGAVANGITSWDSFKGSFLIGKPESFAPFPRSINEINNSNTTWVPVSSTQNDCSNGGLFNGIQYVRENDYSVALLFDKNGIIAGIQMLINQTVVRTNTNDLDYDAIPMYQNATYNGDLFYVLTVYLVQPSTICSEGRTEASLTEDGTGTGLWIQNGESADDVVEVPQDRPESEDEDENEGWTKNNCFPAMGFHNFYSIKQYENTNCTEMVPIFGLYNKDSKKLHGFGFITPGTIINPRFEQPPSAAIRLILGAGRTPQCVLDLQEREGVTSLHVYFISEPAKIACPIMDTTVSYFKAAASWLKEKFSG